MPIEPYNEDTPADTDLASQGDDSIRQFKRAVSERMNRVMNEWPDGDDDLTLKRDKIFPAIQAATVGLYAARPAATQVGDIFFAEDRRILYVSYETAPDTYSWRVARASVLFGTDFPSDIVDAEDGLLFYNTDTKTLYMAVVGTGWVSMIRNSGRISYGGTAGGGVFAVADASIMAVAANGASDAGGILRIPLSSFPASPEGIAMTSGRFKTIAVSAMKTGGPPNTPLIAAAFWSATEVEVSVLDAATGAAFVGGVLAMLHIVYNNA